MLPLPLIDIARICEASYADNPGPGWYNIDDLRFGVSLHDGCAVLCFRGSANFHNWLRDLFVVPKKSFDGYWIHGGVADAVERLRSLVLPMVPKNTEIIVTGHSLGGGVAREFGRMLNSQSATFGALKTDFRFGAMPVNNHFRVIHEHDPVPKVPAAFYVQDVPPSITYTDNDFPFDVADHPMSHYIRCIQGGV